MTDPQLGGPSVPSRNLRVVWLLLVLGVLATVGGVVGTVVARMSAHASRLSSSSLATLPVGTQSRYLYPNSRLIAPDYTAAWIGAIVTGLGVIALVVWIFLMARRPGCQRGETVLIASGVLITVIGVVEGLMAKSSADIASSLASQPTSQISDPSNPIGLIFDPSSAHYVAPDYTVFWIWMVVTALGVAAVLAGIALTSRRRRAA